MAHFVAFRIGLQKNIPLQNPRGGGGYMAAQGLFSFIRKSNFWRDLDVFLDLVILVYLNAISIDFCAVKSFICMILCNVHVYMWKMHIVEI